MYNGIKKGNIMPGVREKGKKSSLHTIRIRPEFHHIAKLAACEKLLTLQAWIEQLIEKEVSKKND